MTVLVDESFATGIPGGFATVRNEASGALTATYNASQLAVDLTNTGGTANSVWDIALPGTTTIGASVIADMEAVTTGNAAPLFGCFFNPTVSSITNAFAWVYQYAFGLGGGTTGIWLAAGGGYSYGGGVDTAYAGPIAVNFTKRYTYRWDTWIYNGTRYVASYLDGALLGFRTSGTAGVAASVRVALAVRDMSARLHSLYISDTPDTSLTPRVFGARGNVTLPGRRLSGMSPPQSVQDLRKTGLVRASGRRPHMGNTFIGPAGSGNRPMVYGKITGNISSFGTPSNTPTAAQVRCHREFDGYLVGTTASDPVTGYYEFRYLDLMDKYTIIAYDPVQNKKAVIADNVSPEAMAFAEFESVTGF